MAYSATGTAGNDTLDQSSDAGPGTIVGLAGDDSLVTGSGLASVAGDSGNDIVVLRAGNTGTVPRMRATTSPCRRGRRR